MCQAPSFNIMSTACGFGVGPGVGQWSLVSMLSLVPMLVGAWLVAAGWLVALVLGVLYIGAVVLYVGGVVVSLVLVRNLDFDRFFSPIF